METKTYNGWSNYETWAVNLWMDNDESSQQYWQDLAADIYKESEAKYSLSKLDIATQDLSNIMKDEVSDGMPDLGACLYSDLLNGALSEVNWYEIAKAMYSGMELEEGVK